MRIFEESAMRCSKAASVRRVVYKDRDGEETIGVENTTDREEFERVFKILFIVSLEGSCPCFEFGLERHDL